MSRTLIIAGGRNYVFRQADYDALDELHNRCRFTAVLSGAASGADRCGEEWADGKGIRVTRFPADWRKHGRAAGPIRNRQMAEQATDVALFPGGRGTDSMQREAEAAGLKIHDFRSQR